MVFIGLAFMLFSKYAATVSRLHWTTYWPFFELGSTLFVTGALVNVWDYVDGRDKEHRENDRIRRLLKEAAPEFRDAVVEGFAVSPEDLARVATPELLDSIATNVLSLRLGDRQFASELYADLRDLAIRSPERWHNVQVRVRLSTAVERSAKGAPLFDVLVEWEYTTIPTHPIQRFACVSDRDDFQELVSDVPATLTWLMTDRDGLDAREQKNYELLAFSVDGEERSIRRAKRASGQVYSASIGEEAVREAKPVRIRQLYRVVTPQSGHRLYFEVGQPTRGFSLEVDYTDTDIAHMSVTELVSSSHPSQVSSMPRQVDARILGIDLPGWLLPKSGFAFVWTLRSERSGGSSGENELVPAKSA
ncbi:MAG: hypothetical protein JWP74_521 [Marmoricola sp.]|nr:hypothetical protein [Marmoricola sp.]